MSVRSLSTREIVHQRASGYLLGVWTTALVILTLAIFQGSLLFAFAMSRHGARQWQPPDADAPRLVLGALATVVIIAGAISAYIAERGGLNERSWQLRAGLFSGATFIAAYLATLTFELATTDLQPSENVYSSLVVTTIGFHLVIAAFAVLMNTVLQVRAWLGHFHSGRLLAVRSWTLFSYFLAGGWLLSFAGLYLSPLVV